MFDMISHDMFDMISYDMFDMIKYDWLKTRGLLILEAVKKALLFCNLKAALTQWGRQDISRLLLYSLLSEKRVEKYSRLSQATSTKNPVLGSGLGQIGVFRQL